MHVGGGLGGGGKSIVLVVSVLDVEGNEGDEGADGVVVGDDGDPMFSSGGSQDGEIKLTMTWMSD